MRIKRFLIVGLVALNLALLGGLIILSYELPAAYAQRGGSGGQYLAVTAEYTGGTDALYLLHTGRDTLVVLTPEQTQTGRLEFVDRRDVASDLGKPSKK